MDQPQWGLVLSGQQGCALQRERGQRREIETARMESKCMGIPGRTKARPAAQGTRSVGSVVMNR
jgi:hypothetical protein